MNNKTVKKLKKRSCGIEATGIILPGWRFLTLRTRKSDPPDFAAPHIRENDSGGDMKPFQASASTFIK
jgi:hypothetical protein